MPDFICRIDGFFEKLLSIPLEFLCRWTGQDNYFFAAWKYRYRDRRNRKRDMRSLWIVRINAAARQHGSARVPVR